MIKPMLAFPWRLERLSFPCFIQPKLNGVRGVYSPKQHMQSRYGEVWNSAVVEHVVDDLRKVQQYGLHMDGEFYKHGMSLQQINSRIAVVRGTPHPEGKEIRYYVFDVLMDEPFYRRALVLNKLRKDLEGCEHVRIVKTVEIASQAEADFYYNQWKNLEGFEGIMYRLANAPYGFASRCGNKENRWWYLQKRKGTQDMDAIVVGMNEMIDSKTGMGKDTLGAFQLRAPNGALFTAGSGLTNEERDKYWKLGEDMNGTRVRVVFEMLSDGQVPLKPTVECVEYAD
jgi:ATP-dependent DNA ligase